MSFEYILYSICIVFSESSHPNSTLNTICYTLSWEFLSVCLTRIQPPTLHHLFSIPAHLSITLNLCALCEDKGQPHIMLAPGAVCLCDSVHTIGAKNGVCVHVCFVLFIHMDEGGFEGDLLGLCLD